MPTPVTESSEGGQHVEWSETFHAFLFRARIYLKRFWWIMILTIAAGALLQAWKYHGLPPVYVSQAEMMVGTMISSGSGSSTTSANEPLINYFATQLHLLQDPALSSDARADAMQLMVPPLAQMPAVSSTASFYPDTVILHLQATGSNPDFTTKFLQRLMEDFLKKKKEMRDITLNEYGINLTGAANKYKETIDELQKQKNDFVSKENLADLPQEITSAGEKLHVLKDHEADLWNQLRILTTPNIHPDITATASAPPPVAAPAAGIAPASATAQPAIENAPSPSPVVPQPGDQKPLTQDSKFADYISNGTNADNLDKDFASSKLLPPDSNYQQLKDSRSQKEIEIQVLVSGGLGPQHPKLLSIEDQIDNLNRNLQVLRATRVNELEQDKAGIETELVRVLEQEKSLLLQITSLQQSQNKLENLDDLIQINEKLYSSDMQTSATLPEVGKLDQEMLTINKPATDAAVQPLDTTRQIGEGAFVGFAAGIVIIFLLGALDGRVMSVEDLTQRFEEPMLGVIPMQKRTNGQVELLKNNDQRQMFAESCRNIRSSLLYMDRQGQRPRVIMLTSSMPSEGKSTLSSNLAITLGFASSRTLLVDADMRRGQLHKRFGMKNDVGLAEHIKDGIPLDKVIQPTGSENLDFISCGHYPTQPGELLMSERFRESIQTMRQRYDFVIFDSPPILLTDDAASFATRADAVVFVVRAGYTRLRQVRTSLESLNRRGVNVYGMVVNFIDHREPGYYSYRYYDYYSYRPGRPSA